MQSVTFTVVGAGDRGTGYGRWIADHPDQAAVVAVAEPRQVRRDRFAAEHGIPADRVFDDWRALVDRPQLSDAVIVATQDQVHAEATLALLDKGYHVLLEKPMASTEAECRHIADAAVRAGTVFAVCHVLRYTPHTQLVKSIVDSGQLGQVVSVQHLEPVGYWHQAHSYVRGNWRRTDQATFMLLAKSCHDLDWLQYIVGAPIAQVASFGGLRHFIPANAPEGATARCLDCPRQTTCPYSAVSLYRGLLAAGDIGWPLSTVCDTATPAALEAALATGPYGVCVYAADNDVVDHQVVALQFADGVSGVFTMTGFNPGGHRRTTIFGSHGQLVTDGERIAVTNFGRNQTETIVVSDTSDATSAGGHGGGDAGLMQAFVEAVRTGSSQGVLSGPAASLSSHLAVFAAERARLTGSVQAVCPTPSPGSN